MWNKKLLYKFENLQNQESWKGQVQLAPDMLINIKYLEQNSSTSNWVNEIVNEEWRLG